MDTHTPPTKRGRARSPQVNITLSEAEQALFSQAKVTWLEPGTVEPRTESLGRTIKRLALQALGANQP
jgi:hypothetical protein